MAARKPKTLTIQTSSPGANFNPIPGEPSTSPLNLGPIVEAQGKQLERQGKILDWTFGFIIAVLVVCVIAFVTFMIDAWRFHAESYNEFTRTIEELKQSRRNIRPANMQGNPYRLLIDSQEASSSVIFR